MCNDKPDWTLEQIQEAITGLYLSIRQGGLWDENLMGHRLEMLLEFEKIMRSDIEDNEKLLHLKATMHKFTLRWCRDEVAHNPNRYCEEFCAMKE